MFRDGSCGGMAHWKVRLFFLLVFDLNLFTPQRDCLESCLLVQASRNENDESSLLNITIFIRHYYSLSDILFDTRVSKSAQKSIQRKLTK